MGPDWLVHEPNPWTDPKDLKKLLVRVSQPTNLSGGPTISTHIQIN